MVRYRFNLYDELLFFPWEKFRGESGDHLWQRAELSKKTMTLKEHRAEIALPDFWLQP